MSFDLGSCPVISSRGGLSVRRAKSTDRVHGNHSINISFSSTSCICVKSFPENTLMNQETNKLSARMLKS